MDLSKTSKGCLWNTNLEKEEFFLLTCIRRSLFSYLLLLLLLSYFLSLDAALLSRTLALRHQDEVTFKVAEQMVEGMIVNDRMVIELNDYPGSGPNSRHDPKNPGKP